MDSSHVENDLVNILFTEQQIQERLAEMALQITEDYEGRDLLVVGVLRGAVMVMARALVLSPDVVSKALATVAFSV